MAEQDQVAGGGIPSASATEPVAPASSPAAAAPPAAAPDPAPAPTPEPVAQPEAAPAAAEPAAPAAPAAEPTLLQKHDAATAEPEKKAEPAKTPDAPKAAAAEPAKAEAAPAEAPAPAPALEPVEYAYELPPTIQMDDATRTGFHAALDAFRTDPTKGAQGLIDLHNQTMQQYADHLSAEQHRVFNETRKGWVTQVMADEQLGGAGHQTAMGAIARMRDLLVPESHREAFNQFLTVTGAGDHPEFLRLLHNAARHFDEAPLPPPDPRPAPNGGARPTGRLRDMYKSSQRG